MLGRLRGLPLPAGRLELAHQFLLLRVDGDDRLALLQERRGRRVDVLELRVPIRVLSPFAGLPQGLETVAERMQHAPDRARTDAPAVCRQRRGQRRATLTRPAKRRGRITPRERVYQVLQCASQARLILLQTRAAGPGPANAPGRRALALGQLTPAVPNRFARQPGRGGHQRVTAVSDGPRLRRGPEATGALIEHRRHRDELGDDRGLEILVARHTRVRSHSPVYEQGNSGQGPNPQFANAAHGDFHLQSTSPAIDAGMGITAVTVDIDGTPRPQRKNHDIGAFEH
jgi:hypothetical protein